MSTLTKRHLRAVPALLRRAARAEWGPLYDAVRPRLARRRWAAVPLATACTVLVLLFDIVQRMPGGADLVDRIGVVNAAMPLGTALAHTPLSLYVPALGLPVWGALAQVLLVFGVAELALGWRRTLALAYTCTLAATLGARLAITLGPDHPLGRPAVDALVRDTGPSAAVVALGLYVAWKYRARFTAAALVTAMVAEAVLVPNLAGWEHLVAVLAAALIAVAPAAWHGRYGIRRAALRMVAVLARFSRPPARPVHHTPAAASRRLPAPARRGRRTQGRRPGAGPAARPARRAVSPSGRQLT